MEATTKINMHISENGLAIIRKFEGLVLHPYYDQVKICTIGYGSTHYPNGNEVTMKDPPITEERAEELLRYEVHTKCDVLNRYLEKYKITLTQNQYDALCSFSFNVGISGLVSSTLFGKIRKNTNDATIRGEFMRWCKAHKPDGTIVTLEGLKQRRSKEADLYFS